MHLICKTEKKVMDSRLQKREGETQMVLTSATQGLEVIHHSVPLHLPEEGLGDLHGHLQAAGLQQPVHQIHQVQALCRTVEPLWVILPQKALKSLQVLFRQLLQGFTNSLIPK